MAAVGAVVAKVVRSKSSKVQELYKAEIGVKEVGGNNKGPRVEEYQKAAGGKPGDSWCSAFIKWVFDKAKIKTTINVWSPTAANSKNLVYANGKMLQTPQPGDVFTLYGKAADGTTRIYHAGFVDSVSGNIVVTVEGNTNTVGSANGDGVYLRKRTLQSIHNISRWV